MNQAWQHERQGEPEIAPDGFVYPRYAYRRPVEIDDKPSRRRAVAIVGGGISGLTAAAMLGRLGVDVVLLDDNNTVSSGTRAIGHARKSLEIWSRIGCAPEISRLGLQWTKARELFRDRLVQAKTLQVDENSPYPPMLVLPQYHVEKVLVEQCENYGNVDIRWKNRVTSVTPAADGCRIAVDTPDGGYELECDWLIAADGTQSSVRKSLGIAYQGERVESRFLIVDVRCQTDLPEGRSFWYRPDFDDSRAILFLRQPGGICRIDFNIAPDADIQSVMQPEEVESRIRRLLGPDAEIDVGWTSLYTVEVRRIQDFRHGRVLFVGDAAHQLSPFGGGRGGNSGVEDVDNLVWKLASVLDGVADASLLDTYSVERARIADENMAHSLRSAEFITPSNPFSTALRDAVLTLSHDHQFARPFVNSGRFSEAAPYLGSPLNAGDQSGFATDGTAPGHTALDAPVVTSDGKDGWLLEALGSGFAIMIHGDGGQVGTELASIGLPVRIVKIVSAIPPPHEAEDCITYVVDKHGIVGRRYDLDDGGVYLFRPDQRIAARWREFDPKAIRGAIDRALCVN